MKDGLTEKHPEFLPDFFYGLNRPKNDENPEKDFEIDHAHILYLADKYHWRAEDLIKQFKALAEECRIKSLEGKLTSREQKYWHWLVDKYKKVEFKMKHRVDMSSSYVLQKSAYYPSHRPGYVISIPLPIPKEEKPTHAAPEQQPPTYISSSFITFSPPPKTVAVSPPPGKSPDKPCSIIMGKQC